MTPRRISWLPVWVHVLGLALALLLPQMLGLLHEVTHDRGHESAHPAQHARANHGQVRTSSLASLFASHDDGSPDCRLYDQARHDGLVTTVAALSLPPPAPNKGVAPFADDALARWAAQFNARGPPLTS